MSEKVLMKGNEAIAEAAIQCGCRYFFGYPITPQTELSEYLAKKMPKVGGLCLQAESEVAAINMTMGAAASGVRVITSSSSPGISLKSEGISYIAGCDLPCVIINIQRGGPGLGGIQPSQADYYQATRGVGHGDLRLLVFAPSSVQEMAQLTIEAFDLADIYRMPAMILADGALGQMMEPVDFGAISQKELPAKDWAACGHENKRKKNVVNSLYIDPQELETVVDQRYERYAKIEESESRCEEHLTEDADIILVSFGITARVCKTAIGAARAEGIKVGMIRPITLWPFPKKAIYAAACSAKAMLSVEMSKGQMVDDVRLAANGQCPVEFYGRTGGMIPTPDAVLEKIRAMQAQL